MSGGIFLIQNDGELVEMSEQAYDSEDLLQALLAKYPSLLAGDQIESSAPRRWLLIKREMGIPATEDGANRWSVDHLFLDQDAIPTLVEVKRSSDTRIRREVVGQMLDYAANAVVYWPVESMRAEFESNCKSDGREPLEELAELLGDEADADGFWQNVKTNLQAGKIRMVFVADEIPSELRRIVEFLNEQMDPAQVLAVEIKQYVGESMKTLVPRLIGQTAEAQKRKGSVREERQWDEASFFSDLANRHGTEEAEVARRLYEWAKPRVTRFWFGKGKQDGSIYAMLDDSRGKQWLLSLWSYGKVEIPLGAMRKNAPFADDDNRKEFLRRLNNVPGVSLPPDSVDRYPRIETSKLTDQAAFDQLVEVLDWAAKEIENTRTGKSS